jgi:hypothetical protein
MTSISRGCPSTGWMLALGTAHSLPGGHFVASASFGYQDVSASRVDGGYRISGT